MREMHNPTDSQTWRLPLLEVLHPESRPHTNVSRALADPFFCWIIPKVGEEHNQYGRISVALSREQIYFRTACYEVYRQE